MLLSSTTLIDISKLSTKTARIKYNNGKHDNVTTKKHPHPKKSDWYKKYNLNI